MEREDPEELEDPEVAGEESTGVQNKTNPKHQVAQAQMKIY